MSLLSYACRLEFVQSEYLEAITPMSVILIAAASPCHPCRLTENELKRRGVEYTKYSITDPGMSDRAEALGIRSLPIVIVDETTAWGGFQPTRIRALPVSVVA